MPGGLSVAIMAHPSREHQVRELMPQLPGARVVWDRHSDRWDTGRRSMLAYEEGAEWHLVVQDDALLCRDFLQQVHQALQTAPPGPVAFYMGTTGHFGTLRPSQAAQRAQGLGLSWIEAPGPWWGVAVAVPTREIPAMLAWCEERPEVQNYDRRMSRYWHHRGVPCRYSVPSLAQHRTGEEHPSLVPGRGNSRSRVAALWSPEGRTQPWREPALALHQDDTGPLYSVAIMGHPSRLEYLEELLPQVGEASVVLDEGQGLWATAVAAWQARDTQARYHVVLQDDAVLCEGFHQALQEVLLDPFACHSLYLGANVGHVRRLARRAVRQGQGFLELERLYWGVGIVLPTALVPAMLRWTCSPERQYPDAWKGRRCDTRVSRWCMEHRVPVRYPLPSLVDHRVGPSLVGGYQQAPHERVAWWLRGGPKPWAVERGGAVAGT